MATSLRRIASVCILLLVLIATATAQKKPPTANPTRAGIFRGHRVTYQIIKGRMITEGDIALDHIAQKLPENGIHPGATLDYLQYLWPKVGSVYQIAYTIDPASGDVSNINSAISAYNSIFSGIIQWVPQTSETDYVDFDLNPSDTSGVGNSYIGRVGGEQLIWGSGSCTVPTLLHEMGHATGMWHEQSRPDRNNYVTVLFANMINAEDTNSAQQFDDMQAPTLYDWSSLMHYSAWQFTKNGAPTLESIPAGMPLTNNVGYSAGDIDAIKRLYQAVPTAVTVTTNPPGLQAIVDGATVTTPQTYNWSLFSTHTLAASSNAQTLNGTTYIYGRWNDNGALSHTITVLPGNGELATPATEPAVTVYMGSFIQLVPYTMAVSPLNSGTVTPNPAPQSYSGVSGVYYTARQQVTLTANPNSGQNFYQYINSPFWLPGGLSINPKTFYVMDDGTPINTTTYFTPTSSPTYTIDSNPDGTNFYVIVDGNYWPAPTSFSPYYNSAWAAGSNHTIAVNSPEWPWTFNTRYEFQSWSDGGAVSHSITAPSASTTYTAALTPQYYLSDYANQGCAGSINVVPSSPTGDGFYPTGTLLTFTETPASGWTFTEWQNDLTGTGNPQSVTMSDELLVTADYNTVAAPLTLTSISPSAAVAGGGNFTLILTGSGFTSGTLVFVNNVYRTSTFVSANEITVAMTTADLATPGGFQIFAENFPNGAACAAYSALPFSVASSPVVKPTPLSELFAPQVVGTTSASRTISIKNTSYTSVTINSIATTGNFTLASKTCGSSLAAGATCTAKVTFTPGVPGVLTGSLAISDSAPDSPQTVALSGTSTFPLAITPASLSFGTVSVGSTSSAKIVSLTNNETSSLNFSFAASGNYAVSSTGTTCATSLASKATCNIAVTFSPTANGAINGGLTISDSTSFNTQLVALSGAGSGGTTPPLTFTPATITFAREAVGTTSAARAVTVKNVSASTLTLNTIAASGEFAAAGSGAVKCAASLQLTAGASCTMSVTFSPAFGASGILKGAVVISDNGAVGQQVLDVQGTAVLPLTFAPTSLTFAPQTVATTSAPQTVTLTNNLATAMSTLSITGNGDFAAVAGGATPCTSTLAAHASCTVVVTFTPSAIGTRASAITVSGGSNPALQTVNVTGMGQ
jgi:hypothetical protein